MDTSALTSQYNFYHFSQETTMILKEMERMNDHISQQKRIWDECHKREVESLDKSLQSLGLEQMGHNSPVRNVVLHDQQRTAFSIQVQPQRRSSRPDNIDLSFPPIYHNQPRSFQNSTFFQNKRQQQHPPPPPPPPTPQYQNHVYQGFTNQDILGPFVQSMPNNKLSQGQAQDEIFQHMNLERTGQSYPGSTRVMGIHDQQPRVFFAVPRNQMPQQQRRSNRVNSFDQNSHNVRSFLNSHYYPRNRQSNFRYSYNHQSSPGHSNVGQFSHSTKNLNQGQGHGQGRRGRHTSSDNYDYN